MRWVLVMVRGGLLPSMVLLLGGIWWWATGNLAANPIFAAVVRYQETGVDVALATALAAWCGFAWRLWAWERGVVDPCSYCGGPLGRLRMGRQFYGRQLSDFRRCYCCNKANAVV